MDDQQPILRVPWRTLLSQRAIGKQLLNLVLLSFLAWLGGCSSPTPLLDHLLGHPFLSPEMGRSLREGQKFDPDPVVQEQPADLTKFPVEPPKEIAKQAQEVAKPRADTPTIPLSLLQVRCSALQNNLDLRVQEFNPAIATEAYRAEFGKFESVFTGGLTRSVTFDGLGLRNEIVSVEPAILVPTRAGGTVSIGLPFSRTNQQFNNATAGGGGAGGAGGGAGGAPGAGAGGAPGAGAGGVGAAGSSAAGLATVLAGQQLANLPPDAVVNVPTFQRQLDVGVSQPLLRNAGFQISYASINVLGLSMRQVDARTKLFAIRILANAEQAYWRYYAAYGNLKIQVQQYDLAVAQLQTATSLVGEGVLTRVEIIIAEANVARRLDAVVQAELTRRLQERALRVIINAPDMPVTSTSITIPTTAPAPAGFTFDRPKVVEQGLSNRMELFENELQLIIDGINSDLARNAILPDVKLDFKYSFIGAGTSIAGAWDTAFPRDFDTTRLALTANIPLQGDIAARARYRQTRLRQAQTSMQGRSLQLTIRSEVLNSVDGIEENWQRILTNRAAVRSNQENYNANLVLQKAGKITGTELSLVQQQLADAQSTYVQSLADFQISLVDLVFATGTVLGGSGVIWHGAYDPVVDPLDTLCRPLAPGQQPLPGPGTGREPYQELEPRDGMKGKSDKEEKGDKEKPD